MIRNETRESAHLRSRVRDLSVVPNIVSYTALLAAITPLAKLTPKGGLYEPILIRDVDSLIANFGDPKIDPEKYIDLYSIMQLVSNGTSCYVAKVPSGNTGEYDLKLIPIDAEGLIGDLEKSYEDDNTKWSLSGLDSNICTVTSVGDLDTPIASHASHGEDSEVFTVTAKDASVDLDNYSLNFTLSELSNPYLISNTFIVKTGSEHSETSVELKLTLDTFDDSNVNFTKSDLCAALKDASISINKDQVSNKFTATSSLTVVGSTQISVLTDEVDNLSALFTSENKLNVYLNGGASPIASFISEWLDAAGAALDVSSLSDETSSVSSVGFYKYFNKKIDVKLKDSTNLTIGSQEVVLDSSATVLSADELTDQSITNIVACNGAIGLDDFTSSNNYTVTMTLNGHVEYTAYSRDKFSQEYKYDKSTNSYTLELSAFDGPEPYGNLRILQSVPEIYVVVEDIAKFITLKNLPSDKYAIYRIEKLDDVAFTSYESKPEFTKNNDGTYNLKVNGTFGAGTYKITLAPSDTVLHIDSSMADELNIGCKLTQAKPYPLKLFYLEISVATEEGNSLGKAKVKLDENLTNQSLVNTINSSIGAYTRFRLEDTNSSSTNSIVQGLLNKYAPFENGVRKDLENKPTELQSPFVIEDPSFKVSLDKYSDTLAQYKDKKYVGCLMADMVCPVTDSVYESDSGDKVKIKYVKELSKPGMDKWPRETSDDTPANVEVITDTGYVPLTPSERRSLHYNMKQIACERKDTTVILSTPYNLGIGVSADKDDENKKTYTYDTTEFTLDEICDWVSATGSFANLWEYGEANQTDYALQSFYLEMYYSWLNMKCTKIDNGLAKSVTVNVAPANLVIENILRSWRERGVQYPVAGDQYGTLPETCTVLKNPKTKLDRDQLVQYRINPIYDTGTRGVQIYGNETLNPGYTDLNAAHIARTLVYIRSTIDEYTEKLKFSINSLVLWDTWKSYVSQYILEPLKSANALAEYVVAMGEDTTTAEEIANRVIRGNVALRFYQSAEIFDLTYNIYSSATTLDEAMSN